MSWELFLYCWPHVSWNFMTANHFFSFHNIHLLIYLYLTWCIAGLPCLFTIYHVEMPLCIQGFLWGEPLHIQGFLWEEAASQPHEDIMTWKCLLYYWPWDAPYKGHQCDFDVFFLVSQNKLCNKQVANDLRWMKCLFLWNSCQSYQSAGWNLGIFFCCCG